MPRRGLFTKEQLAKPFDLAPDTIDTYVACDLLHPIRLNDGLLYTSNDMLRLEIILKGKRLGYTLHEVKLLIETAQKENAKES